MNDDGSDLGGAAPSVLDVSFVPFSFAAFVDVGAPKSSEVAGVLGVFAEDLNEANAPEPRPKAEEAPLVGDATPVVVKGAIPLKGPALLLKDPSVLVRFAD